MTRRPATTAARAAMHDTGVEVRRARIGKGLFATRAFRRGEVVLPLTGRVVPWQLLWRRSARFLADCIRFGAETYLHPGRGPGRWLNHSCQPNCAVDRRGRRLVLWAVRAIRRGEELCFDYATTIGDDDIWRMRCRCGARHCRGVIGRLGALPRATLARYLRCGMVPAPVRSTLGATPD